ncbi:MAG: hypothetical protein E7623_05740 [Ruminococcaceae bacterium]|nr:hypothetical protein [Oscillospiraceae bacterium]
MEQIKFVLNDFDGPLDLLLTLIAKNKMNIYDIPIVSLFEQYMQYIEEAQRMDMEIAGEFIAMASYLMLIKSRTLLPKNEENKEEDPRLELTALLLEYKRAKDSAPYFKEAYASFGGRFAKDTEEISVSDGPFEGSFEIDVLLKAFDRVLLKMKENEGTEGDKKRPFEAILNKYVKPVHEMIKVLVDNLREKGSMRFEDLLGLSNTRSELVASFLAILEMLSTQKLLLHRDDEVCYIELNKEKDGVNDGYEQFAEYEEYN